jgi:hypothetical protein
MKRKLGLYVTFVIAVISILGMFYFQLGLGCYGPQVAATSIRWGNPHFVEG